MKASNHYSKKQIGRLGEEIAVLFIQNLGYHLVSQNWRCQIGEIDIIAQEHDTLVFIEVKSRLFHHRFGAAKESITIRKQQKIRTLAKTYLSIHHKFDHKIRFDCITVEWNDCFEVPNIQHLKAAF